MPDQTLHVPSLCAAFQQTAASRPDSAALRTADGAVEITWRDYAARVRRIAAGLAALGVRRGDTVGLMMTNRPEFHLCDTGAMHLGAVPFSVYNTLTSDQIAYLFHNAENRVVICEAHFVPRLPDLLSSGVEHVICVDGRPPGTMSLAELEAQGEGDFDFDTAWRAVGPDDLLTLIYTSGTTGPPKGVEITHGNMLAELRSTTAVLPVRPGDRAVSYLPSAHVADRWQCHYLGMSVGLELTSVLDPRGVLSTLPAVRPTIFGGVPRIWEKMKAGIEARLELDGDPVQRDVFRSALDLGRQKVQAEQAALRGLGSGPGADLLEEYTKADAAVLAPLRYELGLDQVRWSMVGAAPASLDVLEFFSALGLPICEGWGMSELSCVATVNPPGRTRFGTVGPALPGVELALADDGELLCRGAIVMRGYRHDKNQTAEAIDGDGWLHTGDIARLDDDGYVSIVDRKKELIINAAGKNMSPANIEATLKASTPLIGQAMAVGDRRPYNVALVVLDPDAGTAFAAEHSLCDASPAGLASDERVISAVSDGIRAANEQLARVEQIKRFVVLPVDWEVGGDELTPTMKLRRRPIEEKYRAEIEALYRPASEA